MNTPVSVKNYETFGPEWQAYVMKMRKVEIVEIFAMVGREREALKALIVEVANLHPDGNPQSIIVKAKKLLKS